MMNNTGPRGLGDLGLLGAPSTAQKNRPKFLYHNHTPHSHTHCCECNQFNIYTPCNKHNHTVGCGCAQQTMHTRSPHTNASPTQLDADTHTELDTHTLHSYISPSDLGNVSRANTPNPYTNTSCTNLNHMLHPNDPSRY